MWSPSRILGVLIVGFWLVMMGLLVQREYGPPVLSSRQSALTGPSEVWMQVLTPGNQPVGYVQFIEKPAPRGDVAGTELTVRARASLNLLGRPADVTSQGRIWRALDTPDAEFDVRLRAGDHVLSAIGRLERGMLTAKLETGGETIPVSLPVGEKFTLSANGLGSVPDLTGLKPGDQRTLESFDPMSLSMTKTTLRVERIESIAVLGETREATVVALSNNGMTSTAWVGTDGEFYRVETSFGFVLARCTADEALAVSDMATGDDLLDVVSIKPTGLLPKTGATGMRIRIEGLGEGIAPEADRSQTAGTVPGEWIIEPRPADGGGDDLAQPARWLGSTPFIQTSHPRIQAQAAEIVGDATDPWDKAQRIYGWVYETIRKEPVVSVPSALDVLDTREGDCNEHTILFTALARAVGIPTEVIIGVVWSDELEGFYYHAWPAVYVGQWVWMDPTLGQPVADATHIKLLSGGIDQWPRLAPFLTRLRIDVLEVD